MRLRELDYGFADINITVDAADLQLALDRAARTIPREIAAAAARAQGRAVSALRTIIVRELRQETTLIPKAIAKAVRAERGSLRNGEVSGLVRVNSSRLPISRYEFAPHANTSERGKRPGERTALTYRLAKGGTVYGNAPRDSVGSKLFVAKLRSGHVGVFTRIGSSIVSEFGPSVQFHVAGEDKRQHYEGILRERFLQVLEHEIAFRGGAL